ncbi:GNAT family N-acetyltransferase [Paludibacterium purpuratum]|uniref:Acetyltransferase (GNAT) family protein n=1 Tax=Paludibacterium purpuratum TaxID=1144873 RepID=A0A4R7B8G1_9NEIS|nr:GNAT family N-acetyltransferase [Paludibacterium purpuratum]TDR79887.1 acetyltransferase (GNAT) family protein [Paludibacterium purpuratum]
MPITFDTDPQRLDRETIYRFLSQESYWARDLPRAIFERSLAGSLCFGGYDDAGTQVAFARVVTDRATFGYLADVFVHADWRGQGIGKALVRFILDYPELQDLRRFMLATADAHSLYAGYGFTPLSAPDRLMERLDQGVYRRLAAQASTAS